MSPVEDQVQPLIEWGWRAAIGFIVTGLLGLLALAIRKVTPVLGERLHRVYGERAFKSELAMILATSEAVGRMQPVLERTSEQVDKLETRVESGFAAVDSKLERIGDNILALAKAVGRVEAKP